MSHRRSDPPRRPAVLSALAVVGGVVLGAFGYQSLGHSSLSPASESSAGRCRPPREYRLDRSRPLAGRAIRATCSAWRTALSRMA